MKKFRVEIFDAESEGFIVNSRHTNIENALPNAEYQKSIGKRVRIVNHSTVVWGEGKE
jgi:hypothetical protein